MLEIIGIVIALVICLALALLGWGLKMKKWKYYK